MVSPSIISFSTSPAAIFWAASERGITSRSWPKPPKDEKSVTKRTKASTATKMFLRIERIFIFFLGRKKTQSHLEFFGLEHSHFKALALAYLENRGHIFIALKFGDMSKALNFQVNLNKSAERIEF